MTIQASETVERTNIRAESLIEDGADRESVFECSEIEVAVSVPGGDTQVAEGDRPDSLVSPDTLSLPQGRGASCTDLSSPIPERIPLFVDAKLKLLSGGSGVHRSPVGPFVMGTVGLFSLKAIWSARRTFTSSRNTVVPRLSDVSGPPNDGRMGWKGVIPPTLSADEFSAVADRAAGEIEQIMSMSAVRKAPQSLSDRMSVRRRCPDDYSSRHVGVLQVSIVDDILKDHEEAYKDNLSSNRFEDVQKSSTTHLSFNSEAEYRVGHVLKERPDGTPYNESKLIRYQEHRKECSPDKPTSPHVSQPSPEWEESPGCSTSLIREWIHFEVGVKRS